MIRSALSSPLRSALSSAFAVRRGGGAPAFDPATLFVGPDQGGIYDKTRSTNLLQLSGGSGAVAVGDPIGYVADLGPIVRPALQATAASRPVWAGAPRELGSELVTNGRFATDTDWTKGTGWTINTTTGRAEKVAGTADVLSIPITVTAGKFYFLPFYITRTAGTVTARLTGGTTVAGTARSYIGSYLEIFQAVTGNVTLEFSADATFAGSVGNVSLKEVTSFTNMGALFDGSNDFLRTANIDMTAGQQMTIVASFVTGQVAAARTVVTFGNVAASTAGSTDIRSHTQLASNLRGATSTAITQPPLSEAPEQNEYQHQVISTTFDLSGATIADQVVTRARGVAVSNSLSGSLSGGGNLANLPITIGAAGNGIWPHSGLIRRLIVINRKLSAGEISQAEAWCSEDSVFACVVGDSTSALLNSSVGLPQAISTASLVGGLICGAADIATSGDRISDQKTKWTALPSKMALEVVIVQIGLNDVKNRVGANTATTAQVITDLQDLINTINADKPAGCKVYVSQMNPCKTWLDGATNPSAAYAAWQDVNTAIAGGGATPITGVDGRITSHVAALSGAGDTLDAKYNMDGVHENNEGRFIIAQAWRAALEAGGLL
jgi:lysophospholipase L1-like esterase